MSKSKRFAVVMQDGKVFYIYSSSLSQATERAYKEVASTSTPIRRVRPADSRDTGKFLIDRSPSA